MTPTLATKPASRPRLLVWCAGAVLALVAVGNVAMPGIPLGLQVVHVIAVFTALAVFAFALSGGSFRLPTATPVTRWALVAIGGYLAANLIATADSIALGKSLKATLTLILGIAVAVAILLAADSPRRLRLLLATASIGSAVVTVPTLLGSSKLEARLDGAVVNNRPTGAFSDPNEFGDYCAIALLLALGWLLSAKSRRERLVAVACAVSAAGGLAMSLSRGAWLGAAVGVIVLAAIHPRARIPFLTVATVSAVVVAGAVTVQLTATTDDWSAPGPIGIVADRALSTAEPSANPYDVRPITYGHAIREFSAHPIIGQGPGSFAVLQQRSDSPLQFYPRQHAHNGALTVAAETGLLGLLPLVAMVLLLVVGVRRAGRALRAGPTARSGAGTAVRPEAGTATHPGAGTAMRPYAGTATLGALAGSAGALTAVLGHLMVDFPLRNPTLAITIWAVIGLLMAAIATGHRQTS